MSRGGICDSRCQAFYTAMIEKEESMRMRWFVKNQQKLLEHLEKTKPAKKIELPPIREPERKEPSVDIVCDYVTHRINYPCVLKVRQRFLFFVDTLETVAELEADGA